MTQRLCPCGRPGCADTTPLCVLCPTIGRGRPNHTETSQACPACAQKLTAIPDDIADAHALLQQLLEPRRGAADTRQATAEAPIPLAIDPYDLTADHLLPQGPLRRARLAANAGDQIGHLPVAVVLHSWVRDWADQRDLREQGPAGDVPELARWLAERTDWACAEHPALDEYAAELHELRGTLLALVGRAEPDERPKPIKGVPCIRCRHVTLARRPDGSVECQWPDCASVWRDDEYERWSRAASKAAVRTHQRQPDGRWVPREDVNA